MNTTITRRLLAGSIPALAAASALLAPAAHAQFALNSEFVVNQTTSGNQNTTDTPDHTPRMVDELTDGNRIVAYYDAANTRHRVVILDDADTLITEIDLGALSTESAAVAALSTGGFVAVYGTGTNCRFELFNNAGVSQGAAATISLLTTRFCDVAPLPGGDFVIAYAEFDGVQRDIFAQRFNNLGAQQAGPLSVDTRAGNQFFPVIEPLSSGGFVVTWTDQAGNDGGSFGTYMRAYTAANAPVSASVVVNFTIVGAEYRSVAAPLSDGNIAFSYQVFGDRVFRVLQPDGTEVVAETVIPDSFEFGDLIALSDGRFLSIHGDNSSGDIRLVEYQNDGTLLSDALVNTTTADFQRNPRAGVFSDDSFLFIYSDFNNALDGSGHSVLARSFDPDTSTLVELDASSDFSGQVLASEATGTLAGDLILDFGLSGKFNGLGAAGVVDLEVRLNNATFTSIISNANAPDATDNDCDFAIRLGGGIGSSSAIYRNTGTLNACSGASANDATITLPIQVTTNGQPVSVDVIFTPISDAGTYTGSTTNIALASFQSLLSYTVDFNNAAAPPVGQFDINGNALQGSGQIGRIATSLNGAVNETSVGGGAASADSADDIVNTADVIITFPSGATGLNTADVDLDGVACPAGGTTPPAAVFICNVSGATVNGWNGAGPGLITITADADNQTAITAQTPTVELSVNGDGGFDPADVSATAVAPLSLDDGLDTTAITNGDFEWVNLRSQGGTTSRFRITGIASALNSLAGEGIQVTVNRSNGTVPTTTGLIPNVTLTQSVGGTWTATFSSEDLAAAVGTTGLEVNGDITLALVHDDTVNHAGAQARRLLTRNGVVTGTMFD